MDTKSIMTAVRLASQRDAAIAAQAEAALEAARAASNNIVGIDFEQSNVTSSYALDVAYGDGLWLAGSDTATYYSSDGKEWTQNTTISKACSSFTYANGLWVAGGYAGGGLYYSVDGKSWTQSNITDTQIRKTAYANGLWVAGGNSAGLYYSEDGKNWTASNVTSGTYNHIVHGDGLWMAGGTALCYYSTDGKAWTQSSLARMTALAYADGVWLSAAATVSMYSYSALYRSEDGINWTLALGGAMNAVAYGNGMWLVAGSGTTSSTNVGLRYSSDGITWNLTNIKRCMFNDICYADGLWVAAADNANETAGLYYSLDGKVWEQTNVAEGALARVAYADGMWVAASDYGEGGRTGLYYGQIKKKYATPDDIANGIPKHITIPEDGSLTIAAGATINDEAGVLAGGTDGGVKTVNGIAPDENGNVVIETGSGDPGISDGEKEIVANVTMIYDTSTATITVKIDKSYDEIVAELDGRSWNNVKLRVSYGACYCTCLQIDVIYKQLTVHALRYDDRDDVPTLCHYAMRFEDNYHTGLLVATHYFSGDIS